MKKISVLLILVGLLGLNACSPKNKPRQVHEPERIWKPTQTPTDSSVEAAGFNEVNLERAYGILRGNDVNQLINSVLVPLSSFVLNSTFVEDPQYRTTRLTQMIHLFHQALLKVMVAKNQSAKVKEIKDAYYQTVLAGCRADLTRDCINVRVFAEIAGFTRIMTLLAQELDAQIAQELATNKTAAECIAKSTTCRAAIEERYRRLAVANMGRSRNEDLEFSFSYMKYARVFALLMDHDRAAGTATLGYVSEVHGKIFETIIAHYNPSSLQDPEFKAFVENFNPWIYSQKRADAFQYGTKIMFKFGAECCLYQDQNKTVLSNAVKTAIVDSQQEADVFGPSFHQMIKEIQSKFGNRLFHNLKMTDEIARLENLNSSFYNEFFLVVDRLFRGHLSTAEVEMVLRNTEPRRTQTELPKLITTYSKIYLIHMLVVTNDFMTGIYTSDISTDKVFEETTTRSRELTSRWHQVQSQIDLLDRVMTSYFKARNLFSPEQSEATKLIKSVNRNIHYISVYPNMIVMIHFLSKMKGKFTVNTWWGPIDIDPDIILDHFFDGLYANTWFRFGKDNEPLDRQMLLYGWDYMLSTEALTGIDRAKFFELIFTKYLDDNVNELRAKIDRVERDVLGNFGAKTLEALCSYELDNSGMPPGVSISFLELHSYTYSGLGNNGINALLNKLLSEPQRSAHYLRREVDSRMSYLKSMLDLVEHDLIRSGQIKQKGEAHADTKHGYEMLNTLAKLKLQIAKLFIKNHKRHFECSMRLQEVERRRINRLYEEERAHLNRIFDMISPLVRIKDKAVLDQEINRINETYFRAQGSEYRFDHFFGLTYRMSKYDLLMRMKKHIERDIFAQLTEEERRVYSPQANAEFARPRRVSIFMPEGVARDNMVTRGEAITLFVNGDTPADRESFIEAGMTALNGKKDSYIQWQGQRAEMHSSGRGALAEESLVNYLYSLIEFYLLGPVTDENGNKLEVTKEDLTYAYSKVFASYTLDPIDIKFAQYLKNDGRFDRAFYEGIMFEANQTRLPFFYKLMNDVKKRSGTLIEGMEGGSAAKDAHRFAQTMFNLRMFIFEPGSQVKDTVLINYGDRANQAFDRVTALFDHLVQLEKQNPDPASLDVRLANPFYLIEGQPVSWYDRRSSKLVDELRLNDHRHTIEDFIRRTGDFYQTRQKVKMP